ncbi:Rossmann fold nucleotide-binding protein [Buttiauxella brennerae ATCC 51605]|uniref:Rossmann fold nucleotide-binding protein n=1 Tax=Buttiauxella brennerae ATCC 51605 TaxID=1354251 RepID=A0A1B7IJ61_9ENTR|nr:DNA-protecting protein DprA [Buttiauxella brennerae]OAT29478.1 Rossmann fold nucleotide-binding protein [Buttiauxella brennerae ATCC 51605]
MSPMEIWLRLMAVQSLSGDKLLKIAHFLLKEPECSVVSLTSAGLSTQQISHFLEFSDKELEESLDWLEGPDHHLLTADSDYYPAQLRAIDCYPAALFVRGDIRLLSSNQLAVVGNRNISQYGERWCRMFCEPLATAGLTITSGLALGIDAVAHRAAINVHGKTIAVLGNGLAGIYPRRHKQLAEQIIAEGGAIISEFPLTTSPYPGNFPRRNRIISGLSRAVFVVEASERSGSLVTARYALEQGRELFALPGAVGSPGSEGPHWLIKQGATLVSHPSDILEHLENELQWLPSPHKALIYSHNEGDRTLPFPELLANVGDEVTPVDVVAERAGQPVPETVAQLLELELAGWIAAVPGGYVRLRRACHVRRTNVLI